MPPRKSQSSGKRAASPLDEPDKGPVSKRTRANTRPTSASDTAASRPRPQPKMRPVPPPSPEVEAPKAKIKVVPKSGLKLSSVGGKGKAPVNNESDEYGEEEIDELEGDSEIEILPLGDKPASPPSVKKVTIRLGMSGKPTVVNPSDPVDAPEPAVSTAKIAFSVEKDGVLSRPIPIPADISYENFGFRVAQAFGEVAGQQDLTWKTNRMPNSVKWLKLGDEEDFRLIMNQADTTLQVELDKFCTLTAQNSEGRAKAKRKGKSFTPKPVPPLRDFIIYLRDRNHEKKTKEAKSKRTEKKSDKAESAGNLKGIGLKIKEFTSIIEKRKCPVCGKNCVILPGVNNAAPIHKELSKGNVQAWAHTAANAALKGKGYSLETVPDELLLNLTQEANRDYALQNWRDGDAGRKLLSRFPGIQPELFLSDTAKLNHSQTTLLFRLITGTAQLNRHLHTIKVVDSPFCPSCGEAQES
ncbi:hypothetical protein FRC06_010058, partial [Ceratobasidium sp. 370]